MLVTSRPQVPISLWFHALSGSVHEDFVLHEISAAVIRHNTTVFLEHELGRIREEFSILSDWPGDQKLELLVAAAVYRFIQDPKWLP